MHHQFKSAVAVVMMLAAQPGWAGPLFRAGEIFGRHDEGSTGAGGSSPYPFPNNSSSSKAVSDGLSTSIMTSATSSTASMSLTESSNVADLPVTYLPQKIVPISDIASTGLTESSTAMHTETASMSSSKQENVAGTTTTAQTMTASQPTLSTSETVSTSMASSSLIQNATLSTSSANIYPYPDTTSAGLKTELGQLSNTTVVQSSEPSTTSGQAASSNNIVPTSVLPTTGYTGFIGRGNASYPTSAPVNEGTSTSMSVSSLASSTLTKTDTPTSVSLPHTATQNLPNDTLSSTYSSPPGTASATQNLSSSTVTVGSSSASKTMTVQPTGEPNSMVPTANTHYPTGTSTVAANIYADNLIQAKNLNKLYSGLTTKTACSGTQIACIQGQIGRCQGGAFQLEACPGDQKCLAFPMSNTQGVSVGCHDLQKAKDVLGDVGVSTLTSSVSPASAVPATTSEAASQSAPKQSATVPAPRPTVTMTTVITISDGAPPSLATPTSQTAFTTQSSAAPEKKQSYLPEPQGALIISSFPTTSSEIKSKTSTSPESSPAALPTSFAYSPFPPLPPVTSQAGSTTISQAIVTPIPSKAKAEPIYSGSSEAPATTPTILTIIDLTPPRSSTAVAQAMPESPAAMAAGAVQPGISNNGPKQSGGEEAASAPRTTQIVDGTPTVSVYLTVTVTEKQRETKTVTLIVPAD